LFDPSDHF